MREDSFTKLLALSFTVPFLPSSSTTVWRSSRGLVDFRWSGFGLGIGFEAIAVTVAIYRFHLQDKIES